MCDITNVAKYTVLRLLQNGNTINPLKLQKILYYMQAWYMVYFESQHNIFEDEPEAWVNGPVYRKVFDEFSSKDLYDQFKLEDVESSNNSLVQDIEKLHKSLDLDADKWEFIEAIFNHYGTMTHDRLVFLTHSQRPWNEAREGLQPFESSDRKISLKSMHDFYKNSIGSC